MRYWTYHEVLDGHGCDSGTAVEVDLLQVRVAVGQSEDRPVSQVVYARHHQTSERTTSGQFTQSCVCHLQNNMKYLHTSTTEQILGHDFNLYI